MKNITLHYLEMHSPSELRQKSKPEGIVVLEAEIKNFRFNKFLYQLVGEKWQWTDKLPLSNRVWQEYAEAENLRTWYALDKGSIAGYYELKNEQNGNIEIAYFGLAPNFIGRGIGGYLLTHAIKSAWGWGNTQRVWVYTCSLDHPNALVNYKARGLKVFKTKVLNK